MIDYKSRIKQVRKIMRDNEADAFVVKTPGNIRYLSCSHVPSFAILTYMVILPRRTIGITPSLEEWRAREQAVVDEIMVFAGYDGIPSDGATPRELLKKVLAKYNVKTLLMDSKERFHQIKVIANDGIERMRETKDEYEIAQIRKAVRITHRVEKMLPDIIKPGVTENQAAADVEHALRSLGGTALSFTCIVATGKYHSAYSHHDVSKKKIGKSDVVIIDFGCYVNGYCSDITRTLMMPNVSKKVKDIYDAVETAQRIGIKTAGPGVPFCEIEAAIRESLKPDYDRYFVHSTGHGFGLEVHERPWVRIATPKGEVCADGHTFTIEPGVYIPGIGGVRIEDDILIDGKTKVL